MVMLKVENLVKYFPIKKGIFGKIIDYVRAVDGIDLLIKENSVLALVGESGSGKTTTARCILRLEKPTAGNILFEGKDVFKLKGNEIKWYRKNVQAVFQNPFLSLNPRMKVESIIAEPLKIHSDLDEEEIKEEVNQFLNKVGLQKEIAKRTPYELSGGQVQRVAIARALIIKPKLVILDEPTSALDVSIQAQILNLLIDLKREFKLSYLLITHDLSIVRYISDYVAVMYLGKIVEYAPSEEIFENPLHPYTQALLSAIPEPGIKKLERITLQGELQSAINIPSGCRFHPRCPYSFERCIKNEPKLIKVGNEHFVSCWLY
ncbi:MAG: ATP-binding cassette domain-containing protein [Thermoproteota archaeon]|jgi:oligopeptide/dipeptide ABC transporter ATP-binding protein|nr:ATP-binding cassette domain-containing protein [Thermoproteota archaeon]